MPYGFYLTDKGAEMIASNLDKEKVVITKACFGSGGNPNLEEFDYGITDLESQFYEKTLDLSTDSVKLVEGSTNQVLIHTVVPDDVSGTISEIGYKDNDDNLILYGLIQKQVKEATEGVTFVYENYIYFDNQENENITFNVVTPEYEKAQELIESAERDLNSIVDGAQSSMSSMVEDTETEFNATITEIQQILETTKKDLDIDSYLDYLKEIEGEVTTLSGTVDGLNSTVGTFDSSINSLESTVSTLEPKVTTLEGSIGSIESDISSLQTSNSSLTERVDALEREPSIPVDLEARVTAVETLLDGLQEALDQMI